VNAVPNFDAMSQAELMAFWDRYRRPTRKDAAGLIGDTRPGYTKICGALAAYACAKATAMHCRLEGKIQSAMVYESHCDLYYQELPEDLQW